MYKVNMHTLIAIKNTLVKSNLVLNKVIRDSKSTSTINAILATINSNEEQIKIITEQFNIK